MSVDPKTIHADASQRDWRAFVLRWLRAIGIVPEVAAGDADKFVKVNGSGTGLALSGKLAQDGGVIPETDQAQTWSGAQTFNGALDGDGVDAITGWVKLAEANPSGAAAVDFTGLTTDYDDYVIDLVGVAPATDAVEFHLRLSTDNGASFDSGSNYLWARETNASNAGGAREGSQGDTAIDLTNDNGNDTDEDMNGLIFLHQPMDASRRTSVIAHLGLYDSGGRIVYIHTAGSYEGSTQNTDAVRLLFSSGNIASGKAVLYGVRA